MDSYNFDWRKTLQLVVENIKTRTMEVIPQRHHLPLDSFKHALDMAAQEAIIDTLTRLDASVRLVSEEGDIEIGGGDFVVVADPVDGTTNLSRGLRPAVASLSVANGTSQSDVFAGVVMNLYTGEIFYAEKGSGASLKGEPIRVSKPRRYRDSLISMDISKIPRLSMVNELIENSQHIRMEGCSAMSLCDIAAGSLDAHIDVRGIVRATDISAGLIMLREAGGVYSINSEVFGDMPLTRSTRVELVAANSLGLMDEITGMMKR